MCIRQLSYTNVEQMESNAAAMSLAMGCPTKIVYVCQHSADVYMLAG